MRRLVALLLSTGVLVGCTSTETPNAPTELQVTEDASPETEAVESEPQPITYDLSEEVVDDEVCKLLEDSEPRNNFYDAYAVSFPANPTLFQPLGGINLSVVPVDWADASGTVKPSVYIGEQLDTLKAFYHMVSDGGLNIEIELLDEWVRLEGQSSDYFLTEAEESDTRPIARDKRKRLFSAGLNGADPLMDFSKSDVVMFILPPEANVLEVGALSFATQRDGVIELTADGNPIVSFIAGGNRWDKLPQTTLWSFWAHEMAHMIGLPDLVLHGNLDGIEMWENNPFSGYDIMAQQDGPLRTINSWTRWVNGWISDDYVICAPIETLSNDVFALSPLDSKNLGETRSLVIKINNDEVLVVENRTSNPRFDTPVGSEWYGLVAYTVSRKLGHGEAAMRLLTQARGEQGMRYLDEATNLNTYLLYGTILAGDQISYAGITIEALGFDGQTSLVRITRDQE